jgi:hypothetical protein
LASSKEDHFITPSIFQIIDHFSFLKYIKFTLHLIRKTKTMYNLQRRDEYMIIWANCALT